MDGKKNTVYQHNRYNPTSQTSGPVTEYEFLGFII